MKRKVDIENEREIHIRPGVDPLPGWEWVQQHYRDPYPDPTIELSIDGKVASLINARKGDIKTLMRG